MPHFEVVLANVDSELERLQHNRHSMGHLRLEHERLPRLVESMGAYLERVELGSVDPADALGLRPLILQFCALIKTQVGDEDDYLRVLQSNLSDDAQAGDEQGTQHAHAD